MSKMVVRKKKDPKNCSICFNHFFGSPKNNLGVTMRGRPQEVVAVVSVGAAAAFRVVGGGVGAFHPLDLPQEPTVLHAPIAAMDLRCLES